MIWLVYLHVISVVIWIGGVSFVTLIVFPALGRMEDSMAKVNFFMGFEKRFQLLAKILVIIVGSTGILLFLERGGFVALTREESFLLGYKFFIWLFYFILLFGAEKRLMTILISLISPKTTPEKAFKILSIFHWVVMILSLIAVLAGIRLVRG